MAKPKVSFQVEPDERRMLSEVVDYIISKNPGLPKTREEAMVFKAALWAGLAQIVNDPTSFGQLNGMDAVAKFMQDTATPEERKKAHRTR